MEFALVVVLAALAGGWAIPAGLLLEVDPVAVFVGSVLGATTWNVGLFLIGERGRERVLARLGAEREAQIREGRAQRMFERWGQAGFSAIGIVVLGPTVTVVAALIFGVERRRFLVWSITGTIAFFAVLTWGWSLVID